MEKNKRIAWVDIGKYICIIFVMLSHLECNTTLLYKFYSPFFLTVFFFLAGYVYKQPESFKDLIKKKVRGLLIPWFIFSNLNIILSGIMSFKGDRNVLSEMGWNMLQIRSSGDGLWFIAALFVAFIPFYFFIKMNRPILSCIVVGCLSIISMFYSTYMNPDIFPWGSTALPWHLEYMFQAAFWMVLGYYFKVYGERIFDEIYSSFKLAAAWMVYVVIAFVPCGGGYCRNPSHLFEKHNRDYSNSWIM